MRAVLQWRETSESESELQSQSVDGGDGQLPTPQPHRGDTMAELRDRVSSFTAEFNSTAAAIEARSNKLPLEEEKAELLRKELERKKDELEKFLQAAKRKSIELEARVERFQVLMKKEIAERRKLEEFVERLKGKIEAEKASVEDRLKELGGREELESLRGHLELKSIQVREGEEAVEEKRKEVEAKEKEMDEQFWSREKKIEEQLAEFRQKQVEFEVRVVEFNAKEREICEKDKRCRELDIGEKDEQCRELVISKKDKQCREPVTNARPWSCELREKKLEEKLNMLSKRIDELELQRMKDSESIEKQVEIGSGETVLKEAKRPVESVDHSSEPNIRLCVITCGRDLQIFLNEHSNVYDSVKDEVERALKLSSDPAKLVLDAMEGFYPPHLKKGGVEYEEAVVRKNCIMLLEWVTKMSPFVNPTTYKEALNLARDWRRKMKSDAEHSLEVVAFLQLLAAFELDYEFEDQLVDLLCLIAHYSQAPLLLRDLYACCIMAEAIREKLLKKEHQGEAAELISAFEMGYEFPSVIAPETIRKELSPAPLLGNNGAAPMESLTLSRKCSGTKRSWSEACREGNDIQLPENSDVPAQQPKRLSSNQDSEDSGEEKGNEENENKNEDSKEEDEDKSLPKVVPFVPLCLTDCTHFDILCRKIGSNTLRCCIEVSDAFRLSSNPARFVLGIVKDPSSLSLKSGLRSVCLKSPEHGPLLLLNHLWRNSPYIKPNVRREALRFAKEWKSKLVKEIKDHVEGVAFLLFLAAYKLELYVDKDDLFSVFGREDWCIPATKLLVILGLKNSIPLRQFLGFLVRKNRQNEALRCLEEANWYKDDPSASSRLSSYLLNSSTSGVGTIDSNIRIFNIELAIWKDAAKHELADESCQSHISDLEKSIRRLQESMYQRHQAPYSSPQQWNYTTTGAGAATPAVTNLRASPPASFPPKRQCNYTTTGAGAATSSATNLRASPHASSPRLSNYTATGAGAATPAVANLRASHPASSPQVRQWNYTTTGAGAATPAVTNLSASRSPSSGPTAIAIGIAATATTSVDPQPQPNAEHLMVKNSKRKR